MVVHVGKAAFARTERNKLNESFNGRVLVLLWFWVIITYLLEFLRHAVCVNGVGSGVGKKTQLRWRPKVYIHVYDWVFLIKE